MPDRMSEDIPDRMSEDMPDRMAEDMTEECQEICQIESQTECQIECQKICQIECQMDGSRLAKSGAQKCKNWCPIGPIGSRLGPDWVPTGSRPGFFKKNTYFLKFEHLFLKF